jgi:hypothetical protein
LDSASSFGCFDTKLVSEDTLGVVADDALVTPLAPSPKRGDGLHDPFLGILEVLLGKIEALCELVFHIFEQDEVRWYLVRQILRGVAVPESLWLQANS